VHEYTIAFRTRYALFESTVMQFDTTIGRADFQGYIKNPIRENAKNSESDDFDDILRCSNSEEENYGYVMVFCNDHWSWNCI
jgi:hypothetical protein